MQPTLPERALHCLLLADPDAKITAHPATDNGHIDVHADKNALVPD